MATLLIGSGRYICPYRCCTDRFSHETIAGSARLAGADKNLDDGMGRLSCIAQRAVFRSRRILRRGGLYRGQTETGIGAAYSLLDELDKRPYPLGHISARRMEQPHGIIKIGGRGLTVREQVDQSATGEV